MASRYSALRVLMTSLYPRCVPARIPAADAHSCGPMYTNCMCDSGAGTKLPYTFWLVLALALGVVSVIEVTTMIEESETRDEATHLAAGYSYWQTGDFRLNVEHPPFSKLFATLPLLWLHP